jgi:choice-of-anchor C domain-containing protein
MRCVVVCLALFACATPSAAEAAAILVNGSFEVGPPPFVDHDLGIPAGSTEITGWTVLSGGVDLLEDPWDVSDGMRAIDLDFRSPGGIEQAFATLPGMTYSLAFDLSGNPEGGSLLKRLVVSVGGLSQEYSFNSIGQAIDALLWEREMLQFVAQDTLTILRFVSLSAADSSYGALIDNVSVAAVPEPSTLFLAGTAVAAIMMRRIRGLVDR